MEKQVNDIKSEVKVMLSIVGVIASIWRLPIGMGWIESLGHLA